MPLVYEAVQQDIGAVFIIGTVDKHRRAWGQRPRGRVVTVKVAAGGGGVTLVPQNTSPIKSAMATALDWLLLAVPLSCRVTQPMNLAEERPCRLGATREARR